MSERVTMPALGESVTEGTVTRWLKGVGETVEVDEPLLEVSTDKVDTEIPSPVAGTLLEILVEEDDTVPVGADLAVIGDPEAGGADASGGGAAEESQAGADTAEQPAAAAEEAPAPEPAESASEPAADSGGGHSASGSGNVVTMPALGESVTEGTVTRWLKAVGEEVAADEALLEVSTDKVDTEIPSPFAGTLTKILVEEDETVPVGAELAVIGGEAQDSAPEPEPAAEAQEQAAPKEEGAAPEAQSTDEPAVPSSEAEEPAQAPRSAPVAAPPAQPSGEDSSPSGAPGSTAATGNGGGYVTPLVRKLAAQHGVDLGSLSGSGVGGRIRKQDVLDAAEAAKRPQPAPEAAQADRGPARDAAPSGRATAPRPTISPKRGTTEKMSRLRKVIAQRMVESLQVSAQLTTVVEVDMSRIATLRARSKDAFREREGVSLSYLPFLALAAVEALKAFPNVNASIDGDQIVYHDHEHLSIAVDTDRGLIVPVVRNAGDLNIAGLARAIADVAERTRTNKITPDDLAGGTFTITNTGSRGALFDTPIINQPQVGILGTGALVKRPVVVSDADGGDTIAVRTMMFLALSYDHRIVDGADAARFLEAMRRRLEDGHFEADLGL